VNCRHGRAASNDALDIITSSRLAEMAGSIVDGAAAAMRNARSTALAARADAAMRRLAPRHQATAALLLILAAVGAHIVMASRLPLAARPTVWLSTAALLVASLAAVAAIARRR
jgi:hypothetical protein